MFGKIIEIYATRTYTWPQRRNFLYQNSWNVMLALCCTLLANSIILIMISSLRRFSAV